MLNKFLSMIGMLLLTVFLVNCNEEKKTSETKSDTSTAIEQVIVQSPGPNEIMTGPVKSSFFKKDIVVDTSETYVTIADNDEAKTGWALWIMNKIPANKDYTVTVKISKGTIPNLYSQFQIKFIENNKNVGKFYYLVLPGTGKVIAQQQATKESATVTKDGSEWVLQFKVKSPDVISTMQFLLMPAVGKKVPTGSINLHKVEISAS